MQIISLDDYQIYIGEVWEVLKDYLKKGDYSELFILVDENTKLHCLPIFIERTGMSPKVIEIQSGEQHKNIHTCSFIWNQLMLANADRNALMINLGGGVIGDMGGFCASTFKRGIDFIQVPTTLLSDVDSSIGGKLGIDFAAVKNSVGLFKNPEAVFIDPIFLKTLPLREIRSGLAEIIKHGLIQDQDLWNQIKAINDLENVNWLSIIKPSLDIKNRIVKADPFEKNVRKKLNFGHTVGHAIESFALNSNQILLHGEAIAIGMICESYLSAQLTGLSPENLKEISNVILKIYDKYPLKDEYFSDFIRLMGNDKKNIKGAINFTLLNTIGAADIDKNCSDELIIKSLQYYSKL